MGKKEQDDFDQAVKNFKDYTRRNLTTPEQVAEHNRRVEEVRRTRGALEEAEVREAASDPERVKADLDKKIVDAALDRIFRASQPKD